MVEYYEVAPPGYVPIEQAAGTVNRSTRTIYEWIRSEGVRTFKRSNEPALVNLDDVLRVESVRQNGRRRKPRPPHA